MKKILLIGFKDVRLAFRDPAALVMMLLAPFLLTVGMGFVTGRFSGGSSNGLSNIPVAIVNLDDGELGSALVDVFQSAELADLLEPSLIRDVQTAYNLVDSDETTAAVVIPAGFSRSIIPEVGQNLAGTVVKIQIYTNPGRPTGAGVIEAIVEEFINRVEIGRIGGEVSITGLVTSGRVSLEQDALQAAGEQSGKALAQNQQASPLINLQTNTQGAPAMEFDILAYMAPGMALMFLMYTVTYGGRSILIERSMGTLPRLLVSPTTTPQVLGGKIFGIYLTGLAQIGILILASTTMFQVRWGDPLGTILLVMAAVFGATGWGMILTAVSRTPGQVASIGSALMLIFGILGGSFISISNLPPWIQWISKITPNAWGLDGFLILARGGSLADLGAPLAALLGMGIILFGGSVVLFNRQTIMQR